VSAPLRSAVTRPNTTREGVAVKPRKERRAQRLDPKASAITDVLIVGSQSEARAAVQTGAGRLAVVERGLPRTVVFECPCGCREVLIINLDPATGRAWRLRRRGDRVTLLPSVWRTTGCKSHFILWDNQIWWCESWSGESDEPWPEGMDAELRNEWRRLRAGEQTHK
jgi:hypothetical protein